MIVYYFIAIFYILNKLYYKINQLLSNISFYSMKYLYLLLASEKVFDILNCYRIVDKNLNLIYIRISQEYIKYHIYLLKIIC